MTTATHHTAAAPGGGNGNAAAATMPASSGGGAAGGASTKRPLSTMASLASLRDQFDARVPADLTLSIVVIGASGDLAKKKTYPALFALFAKGFLPRAVQIVGYARTAMTAEDLRERLRPYLADAAAAAERAAAKAAAAAASSSFPSGSNPSATVNALAPPAPRRRGVDDFLDLCTYVQGEYEPGAEGWDRLSVELESWEAQPRSPAGRLFYLALPPFVYPSVCAALRRCVSHTSSAGTAAAAPAPAPPPVVPAASPLKPAGSTGGGAGAPSAPSAAAAAAASATFSPRRLNSGGGLPPLEDLRLASAATLSGAGAGHHQSSVPRSCDDLGPTPNPRSWVRVVVEKPFGRDLESSEQLASALGELFGEDALYRIDHYLGKELSQNMLVMRFANPIFGAWWNRHYVSNVQITFKEDFGTQGRGGYFDSYGIIRDVIQNHLVQLLALVAMEPPVSGHPDDIRDEKCKVLRAIPPVMPRDCVLGQYTAGPKGAEGGQPGYLDDPTVPAGSNAPTYAACRLDIRNERWSGVPFILRAGKALNERSVTVRMQLRDAAAPAGFLGQAGGGGGAGGWAAGGAATGGVAGAGEFGPALPAACMRNEFVMRLQPGEAVYAKMVVKKPGLDMAAELSELDLSYAERYSGVAIPDAYERLILDCIRGDQQHFVRRDELRAAWAIFTPLLHSIDAGEVRPLPYAYGSRGPAEADELLARAGYVRTRGYVWRPPELRGEEDSEEQRG